MRSDNKPIVAVICDNEQERSRFVVAVESCADVVNLSAEKDSPPLLDLIIVSGGIESGQLPKAWGAALERGEIGRIIVGDGFGDVVLPANATSRELRLACQLLTQNVRLRRRIKKEATTNRELAELALSDALTKISNRRAWDEYLETRFARDGDPATKLCVAILDLDHFKQVNEQAGHAAGDDVLRATAAALQRSVRQNDVVARLGGDEFGLLLTGVEMPAAQDVCERIRQAVVDALNELSRSDTLDHPITASLGVWAGDTSNDGIVAYEAASEALRRAKSAGRDRTEIRTMNDD